MFALLALAFAGVVTLSVIFWFTVAEDRFHDRRYRKERRVRLQRSRKLEDAAFRHPTSHTPTPIGDVLDDQPSSVKR